MQKTKINKTTIVATLLIIIGVTGIVYAVSKSLIVPNIGNVHTTGIEAYWDPECLDPCVLINWEWLSPGESCTKTLYLYNPGNTKVNITTIVSAHNPPEFADYMTLTWTPSLIDLLPQIPTETNVTLKINTDIANSTPPIETFEFDIIITSEEA